MEELRFVCKWCSRRFPSGKSLGGHIRSHVISNSAESDEKLEEPNTKISSSRVEIGESSGYGLRENPKKTWRFSDPKLLPLQQEFVCKQCGKGFRSLKALCGHMACHSEKDRERILKADDGDDNDHSWQVIDGHSDTEVEDHQKVLLKEKQHKRITVRTSSSLHSIGNNSSVSEIDEQQEEEVAISLMMLSRDSGNWGGGVNSVVESSDNNSVVLETKSSSIDLRIGKKEGGLKLKCVYNDGKLKSTLGDECENSESGNFLNGSKKVESDISEDGFLSNNKFKKPESKACFDSRKRTRDDSSCTNESKEKFDKRSKFECLSCKKIFNSFQALGGHRPCNRKTSVEDENSVDSSSNGAEKKVRTKKIKGHECPICLRMFKSGQALGGHKRSHFVGGSENNGNEAPVIKLELIDLNLPAPMEDDADGLW